MKTVKHKKFASRWKPWTALLGAAPLLAAGTASFAEEADAPFVTGTLDLSGNTHFISYGQDIWGAGSDWGRNTPLFNPSLELNFDLGAGWKGILGTWWDVNNNADSSIGNAVQEVDVWIGVSYSVEEWTFTLLYQDWMYAGQSERIVDFKVGYAHWLNPGLTLHARVDNDLGNGYDNGLTTVLGIAPGKEFEAVNLSFPVNVAFDTEGMHAGDAGFSFVSAGVGASVPLTFMPRGDWTFNAGLTIYYTDRDVIRDNNDCAFLTANAGIRLTF